VQPFGQYWIGGRFLPPNQIIIARGRSLLGMVDGRVSVRDAGVKSHWLAFAIDRATTGPVLMADYQTFLVSRNVGL